MSDHDSESRPISSNGEISNKIENAIMSLMMKRLF